MELSAARSLDLLQSSYSFDGVWVPSEDSAVMQWVGTSLGIAGTHLLVSEGELEEIIETPAVAPIPGTKPWVMGVGPYKGGVLPIVSGDVFFRGKAYQGRPREYCLVLRRPGMHLGITLSSVERTLKFPVEQRDMHGPVDAAFADFTLGGFYSGERFLAVLDVDKLVDNAELADAASGEEISSEDNRND